MISRQSTSIIYQVQRIILLSLFTISMISLSIPLIRLILMLSPDHIYPLFAVLLMYMAGCVVLGSYIHTLSFIPFNLASAFDPIKNDLADGSINSLEELARRLTSFTVDFFNFAFLDITHAFFHNDEGIISHENLEGPARAMEEFGMLEMSMQLEDIVRAGKVEEGGHSYHLYILPIWFGDRWLGYMGLLSRRRIGRFSQRFLAEYENNFLDDQLMHIISRSK